MKRTKHIIILILGCLFFGGVIGWSLRSGGHEEESLTHSHQEGIAYTCSMHPQIRQNEPGSCPLCGMALVPVESSQSDAGTNHQLKLTPEAVALSNISTTKVTSGIHHPQLALNGKVQVDETRISNISANFAGRIDQLLVAFTGHTVKKGDRLATIYAPELVTAQKELLEAKKSKDENPVLYQAARNKLIQWRLTPAQIDRLEEASETVTSFDILADVSGVVTQRNVAVGDFVTKGTVLFEIMDLQKVWILLDVYENDLSAVQLGDKINFKANAYPGHSFEGRVSFVDPLLDPQSRTLKIRAEAGNPELLLKPEMFVTALLESQAKGNQESLTIPKSAVLWTGEKSVVYVQVGDRESPAFEMREVELGTSIDERIAVKSGLNLGDEVVSNGAFAVDAAAQLSGHYSMMNRPVSLEVSSSFRKGFDHLMTFYFDLKDQLVSSNGRNAALSAASLHKAHQQINEEELDEKGQKLWEELAHPLVESASVIAQSNDLAVQRSEFQKLSDQVILLLEKIGTDEHLVYKQYCPMADRDNGAYWLSKEKEVRNPYFGEAMMTCGEVKETYQRKS